LTPFAWFGMFPGFSFESTSERDSFTHSLTHLLVACQLCFHKPLFDAVINA
jgi:hypothetical protein